MKLLSSFIIPEAVVRNPHASLFVLFISAFTLFALTGEDNDLIRPRRKKSLFKRIFQVFGEDESPTLDVQVRHRCPTPPPALDVNKTCITKTLQGVVEGTALAAMAEEQDPAAIQEALEKLVKQLEQELCNERQDKERMHESMKVRYISQIIPICWPINLRFFEFRKKRCCDKKPRRTWNW